MKNKVELVLIRTLCITFILGTIILFYIIYKDIDSNLAFIFIKGYLFLVFFMFLYVPILVILKLKKAKRKEVRKRIYNFIVSFIIFAAINYTFDFLFRSSTIDLLKTISISVGLAFGISFLDLILYE